MQVRGLPCAHNFHVECIDEWLRLNVKCPRCRCSVFPNLDLSALSNIHTDTERASTNVVTTTQYVRNQTPSQSYLLRLQGFLRPVRTENAGPGSEADGAETPSYRGSETVEHVRVVVEESSPPRPWTIFDFEVSDRFLLILTTLFPKNLTWAASFCRLRRDEPPLMSILCCTPCYFRSYISNGWWKGGICEHCSNSRYISWSTLDTHYTLLSRHETRHVVAFDVVHRV